MDKQSSKITIKTIAKITGFSTATVSYVINNRTDIKISEKTRNEILEACREYNYRSPSKRQTSPSHPVIKKRTTLKEIAEKANVSTATVSYILSNKSNVKISDETREKVLQICALLQYSNYEQSLEQANQYYIGVFFDYLKNNISLNSKTTKFLSILQRSASQNNCSLILLSRSNSYLYLNKTLKGIIGIGLSIEDCLWLKDNFKTRIACIDTPPISDSCFHICDDAKFIFNKAKEMFKTDSITFIASTNTSPQYSSWLHTAMPQCSIYTPKTFSELGEFLIKNKDGHFIFENEELALLASTFISLENSIVLNDSSQTVLQNIDNLFIIPLETKINLAINYILSNNPPPLLFETIKPSNLL